MRLADDPFEGLYKRGFAFGESDIRTDTMRFTYRDETFTFPTGKVLPGIAVYNGYWYEAKVKDLRKLKNG